MTEAELGALMLAQARAEKHRPGLPVVKDKPPGTRTEATQARRDKVLHLIQRGASLQAIAREVGVQPETVRKDRSALRKEGRL